MTIHGWVATVAELPPTRTNTYCPTLVERAEKLALADLDEPLHISALCRSYGQRANASKGISQDLRRSAVPASSDVAVIPGEARPFVRRWQVSDGNGNCHVVRLRGTRAFFSRVPQSIRRKSFADAAAHIRGWNSRGHRVEPPEQTSFGGIRVVFAMPRDMNSRRSPE
jgi:hypothetical protein